VERKEWGAHNFTGGDKREKSVAVLKPENFGEQMSVDEKMIGEEFYTVMTNRDPALQSLSQNKKRSSAKVPAIRSLH
jgi:hypothetical protein